jgi:hypothetical protein
MAGLAVDLMEAALHERQCGRVRMSSTSRRLVFRKCTQPVKPQPAPKPQIDVWSQETGTADAITLRSRDLPQWRRCGLGVPKSGCGAYGLIAWAFEGLRWQPGILSCCCVGS